MATPIFVATPDYLREVTVHGAWSGPAALSLLPHVLAPVADLTLGLGEVVFDYLNEP